MNSEKKKTKLWLGTYWAHIWAFEDTIYLYLISQKAIILPILKLPTKLTSTRVAPHNTNYNDIKSSINTSYCYTRPPFITYNKGELNEEDLPSSWLQGLDNQCSECFKYLPRSQWWEVEDECWCHGQPFDIIHVHLHAHNNIY